MKTEQLRRRAIAFFLRCLFSVGISKKKSHKSHAARPFKLWFPRAFVGSHGHQHTQTNHLWNEKLKKKSETIWVSVSPVPFALKDFYGRDSHSTQYFLLIISAIKGNSTVLFLDRFPDRTYIVSAINRLSSTSRITTTYSSNVDLFKRAKWKSEILKIESIEMTPTYWKQVKWLGIRREL
jgi:hypothetical protein